MDKKEVEVMEGAGKSLARKLFGNIDHVATITPENCFLGSTNPYFSIGINSVNLRVLSEVLSDIIVEINGYTFMGYDIYVEYQGPKLAKKK